MSKNQSWAMTISMIVLAAAAVFAVVRFAADPGANINVTVEQPASNWAPKFDVTPVN